MTVFARMLRTAKGWTMRNVHSMITCAEFEAFILDYLEDELAPAKRRVFDFHLKICRECRDYLEAYRRSIALGRAVFQSADAEPPPDVPEDLIKAVLEARGTDR